MIFGSVATFSEGLIDLNPDNVYAADIVLLYTKEPISPSIFYDFDTYPAIETQAVIIAPAEHSLACSALTISGLTSTGNINHGL